MGEYDWSVNNALSVHEDKKSAIYSTNQSIHYLPLIYIYLYLEMRMFVNCLS